MLSSNRSTSCRTILLSERPSLFLSLSPCFKHCNASRTVGAPSNPVYTHRRTRIATDCIASMAVGATSAKQTPAPVEMVVSRRHSGAQGQEWGLRCPPHARIGEGGMISATDSSWILTMGVSEAARRRTRYFTREKK